MKRFCQRDKRWGDKLLGFSKTSKIKDWGCKLVCFSCISDIRPDNLNEQFKKDKCFFNGDLLSDEACAKSLGWKFKGKQTNNPQRKCIAEVDFSPAPGKQQHFVVYDPAKKRIFDPWTGDYRPENTYGFVSYRVFTVPNGDSSSKNATTTNEAEKVISTPKEETNPPKIEYYELGEKPTTPATGDVSEPPIEAVFVGAGTTGTEEPSNPVDPNVWTYSAKPTFDNTLSTKPNTKPLDTQTQSSLERFINWLLKKWDKYRDILRK